MLLMFIILFWLVILPLDNNCSVLEVRLQIANQNVFNQRTYTQIYEKKVNLLQKNNFFLKIILILINYTLIVARTGLEPVMQLC